MTAGILHVEVIINNDPGTFIRTDIIQQKLSGYLSNKYSFFPTHQTVQTSDDGCPDTNHISSITMREIEGMPLPCPRFIPREDVELQIHVYRLSLPSSNADIAIETDELSNCLSVSSLPDSNFENEFDRLAFEDDLQYSLLHMVTKSLALNHPPQNAGKAILLHGLPGTGKSSLCRVVAHKATIRLGSAFLSSCLIEVNASGLLHHSLGKSQHLVSKIFDRIDEIAFDDRTLCFVLFDEVESIASKRLDEISRESGNNEVLRATNRLLAVLDKLNSLRNVVVFCTSNLVEVLDRAFLTRMHLMQRFSLPDLKTRYHILRMAVTALVEQGQILCHESTGPESLHDYTPSTDSEMHWTARQIAMSKIGRHAPDHGSYYESVLQNQDPVTNFVMAKSMLYSGLACLTTDALLLAMCSDGLCGRTLARVPAVAVTLASGARPVPRDEAFRVIYAALRQALADGR